MSSNLPTHVAIIMDGNGRWAKRRGLPRFAGHNKGAAVFKEIANYCADIGIKYLTVYAFSTENWTRPRIEVDKLMSLMGRYLDNATAELAGRRVQIKIIGDTSRLSATLKQKIQKVEADTKDFEGLRLNIAVNYGARAEIISAVKRIEIPLEDITEENFSDYLYTKGCPDPDLIIRTGGEIRISNFLLYQAAYSELYYSDVLWPDFTPQELDKAIEDYKNRVRRFGKTGEEQDRG